MKTVIKLEELGMFILGVFVFSLMDYQWWWFLALILTPDLSMVGYLGGNKTGAFLYNLVHHKGIAVLVWIAGVYFANDILLLIGVILFSHASMDRIFGYGLKYDTGFKFTHLGEIGKS